MGVVRAPNRHAGRDRDPSPLQFDGETLDEPPHARLERPKRSTPAGSPAMVPAGGAKDASPSPLGLDELGRHDGRVELGSTSRVDAGQQRANEIARRFASQAANEERVERFRGTAG